MKTLLTTLMITLTASLAFADDVKDSVHEYKVKDIKGKEVDLSEYKGRFS